MKWSVGLRDYLDNTTVSTNQAFAVVPPLPCPSLTVHKYVHWGVTIQWTGLLDWNTGLDYWTDIFLVFAHSMVGFMGSC